MSSASIKYSGLCDRDQAESDPEQIPMDSFQKYTYTLTEQMTGFQIQFSNQVLCHSVTVETTDEVYEADATGLKHLT